MATTPLSETSPQRIQCVLGAVIVFLLLATPTWAQNDEGHIKYRQHLMGSIGASTGAVGDILKYRLSLLPNVETHAKNIAADAKLIASAFREKVVSGATDAKANIWTEWEDFEKAIQAMETAAENLEEAGDDADLGKIAAGMKSLGRSCSGCHKQFRKPKEESYKRK